MCYEIGRRSSKHALSTILCLHARTSAWRVGKDATLPLLKTAGAPLSGTARCPGCLPATPIHQLSPPQTPLVKHAADRLPLTSILQLLTSYPPATYNLQPTSQTPLVARGPWAAWCAAT